MSAVKDKPKRSHGSAQAGTEVVEQSSKRKSKRMSKKLTKVLAPRELVNAVKEERVEDVRRIIEENESLKKCFTDSETKQTLFHTAIRTGSLELVELLISLGVSTCDVDLKFRNALHYLARVKTPSQGLIDAVVGINGLNLSEEDVSGATPLHLAIRYNNTLLTQTLIKTPKVAVNAEDVTGLTPLHYACHEGQESIVQLLLEHGANASARDHKGNTPMHYTCDTGSLPIAKMLLAKGVDVMAVNSKGDTPLHRAVERKQETICAWLTNNGADVMIRYEKRLYEDRHKVSRRKYLRQAVRGEKKGAPTSKKHRSPDMEIEQEAGTDATADKEADSESDGEDLPDDPDGMLSLSDRLDTYGFLVGSEKSNQLVAAEAAAAAHAEKDGANDNKGSKAGKKTKADELDDADDNAAVAAGAGPSADALHEREKSQRKLIKKWVKIMRIWNDKGSTGVHKSVSNDKLRSLVYKGVPNHVRAGVWRLLGATADAVVTNAGRYATCASQPISRKTSHQLDIDINRTNRSHFLFKERYGQGQISLFCILRAYSTLDPVVGYCQGMSDVTALMMQYLEEEEAFWLLVRIMQDANFNMAERFQDDFKGLKRAWYVHDKLVETQLPRLHAHLTAGRIEAAHYTIKWYLKCFLDGLSFDCVLRVWDVLLFEGTDVLYTFVMTLLKYHESAILAIDPAELLMHLPLLKGPPPSISVDSWLKDVKKNPIKRKLLRSYEAEFDAQWPAMIAAIKADADKKQDEWNKKREKARQKEDEAAFAAAAAASAPTTKPTASDAKTAAAADSIVKSPSDASVTEKKSKRRSKIVAPSDEAEEEAAPVEPKDVPNGHVDETTPTKKRGSKRGSSKRKSQRAESQVEA